MDLTKTGKLKALVLMFAITLGFMLAVPQFAFAAHEQITIDDVTYIYDYESNPVDYNDHSQPGIHIRNVVTDKTSVTVPQKIGDKDIVAIGIYGCPLFAEMGYGTSLNVTSLDVTQCSELEYFCVVGEKLSSVKVSGLSKLRILQLARLQLENLDLSGMTALQYLECSENKLLTNLDVSGLTSLVRLNCPDNKLKSIDISGLPTLTEAQCYRNELTSIKASNLPELAHLGIFENNFTSLALSNLPKLESLSVGKNSLISLQLSDLPMLETLNCSDNKLTTLNLSSFPQLTRLELNNNSLSNLDISGLSKLFSLECRSNLLTTLDISHNPNLNRLVCENNFISNISALEELEKSKQGKELDGSPSIIILPQNVATNDNKNSYNKDTVKNPEATDNKPAVTPPTTITPAEKDKWVKGAKGWWYRYADGTCPKNGRYTISGKTYYFDKDGWMKTGWQQATGNSDWYYFGGANDGVMKTNKWIQSGKNWFYLGEEGKMYSGKQTVSGKTYHFADNGAMTTGWKQIGSDWYYFGGANDGVMKTSKWVKSGSKWYYLDAEGKMLKGLKPVDGKTYYFSDSGAMQTGWKEIDKKWYYFGKANDGVMKTNKWVGNYWLGADGVMATDTWVDGDKYKVDASGKWMPGAKK